MPILHIDAWEPGAVDSECMRCCSCTRNDHPRARRSVVTCVCFCSASPIYERSRDPDELHFLIFQVLLAVDCCDSIVLECVAQSLALLQGFQQNELSCNTGYTVQEIYIEDEFRNWLSAIARPLA